MAHPLEGVQAKLDRSLEHLDLLVEQVGIFVKDEPYDVLKEVVEDNWGIGRFHILREPPPRLGAIAGDYAQNLRAALDHLVYQLARLTTESPSGTQFPIAVDEREYLEPRASGISQRDRYLACLKPEHRAMIDAVQPYRGRTRVQAESHFLAHLNRFSNTDKHRLIHAVFGRMGGVEAEVLGGTARVELVPPPVLPMLIEGAEVYRLRISEASSPDVKVKVRLAYAMVFGKYALHDGDFRNIHASVVRVIDLFRPIFG